MNDLISRQVAIDAVEESRRLNHHQNGKEACAHEYEHRHFLKILIDLPSVQLEQKRGKWRHYEGYLTCSECGTEYDDDIMTHCCDDVPRFCPNCGAFMNGEETDNE